MGGGPPQLSHRANRVAATAVLLIAWGMIPWIVVLGLTLPQRYRAAHWRLAWVGFDVALVVALGWTGWAAWFRRQVVANTTLVAATLLICDAWFDVVTSWGQPDGWIALTTAFAGEVPLALAFLWLHRRIERQTVAEIYRRSGGAIPPKHLRDLQAITLRPSPRDRGEGGAAPHDDVDKPASEG